MDEKLRLPVTDSIMRHIAGSGFPRMQDLILGDSQLHGAKLRGTDEKNSAVPATISRVAVSKLVADVYWASAERIVEPT